MENKNIIIEILKDNINEKNPLVSIIVITYNSAEYVLETLESAKAQEYQKIELIVSDDCSTDDTIEICRSWLAENKKRFVRAELITVEKNSGIAPNCNRGLLAAKGEWVKFIAGDDILLPNCINDNIKFAINNSSAKFIFSTHRYLINSQISHRYYFRRPFFKKNQKQQYKYLLEGVGVNSPTSFISRADLIKLGGFNNNYPFLEDAPLWLEASKNGYKLHAFESATVLYRIHPHNTCLNNGNEFLNLNYYKSQKIFYDQIVKKELVKNNKYLTIFSKYIEYSINNNVISKGNKKSDYTLLLKFISLFNISKLIGLNGYFNKHTDYNNIK